MRATPARNRHPVRDALKYATKGTEELTGVHPAGLSADVDIDECPISALLFLSTITYNYSIRLYVRSIIGERTQVAYKRITMTSWGRGLHCSVARRPLPHRAERVGRGESAFDNGLTIEGVICGTPRGPKRTRWRGRCRPAPNLGRGHVPAQQTCLLTHQKLKLSEPTTPFGASIPTDL